MDRLTERSEHGFAYIKETRHGLGGRNLIKRASVDELVNRLAAYEDTGLAPDEVEALKTERVALWQEVGYTDGDHVDAARFFHELEGTVNRLTDDLATAKAERDRFKARAEAAEMELGWIRNPERMGQ